MPEHDSDAVHTAKGAVEDGHLEEARSVLVTATRTGADPEALRLLGEVHYQLGDLPAAGAAWFGAGVKGDEVDEATTAWRSAHGDDFAAMWASLPRGVRRHGDASPKVAALRAKAQEVHGGSESTPAPSANSVPASHDTAAAPRPATRDGGRAAAGGRATTGGTPAADGNTVEAARGIPVKGAGGIPKKSSRGGDASPGSVRDAASLTKVTKGGGVDAAHIIAWVIAVFVVICAIVGLVQILKWMIPGG